MQLTDPRPQLLFILLLLLSLLLAGCRSKQSVVDKKETAITELQQNEIEKSEQLHKDVSVIRIERKDHFSIIPVDGQKMAKVVYKGDTLAFDNARIDVGSERNAITKNDRSVATTTFKDVGRRELEVNSEEKRKESEVTSASWGLNLAIIVGVIVLITLAYVELKVRKV